MPSRTYNTISVDLVEFAEQAVTHFEGLGYVVGIEKSELGFPVAPTLTCRRGHTTVIVEVCEQVSIERVDEWIAYCRSAGQDTRLAIALPEKSVTDSDIEAKLQTDGVGLFRIEADRMIERLEPRDLAIAIELPVLKKLAKPIRALLGDAYEQFSRKHWREGFEDACQALEEQARRYLKAGCKAGRIKVVRGKKGPAMLTATEINKMTMGQLADTFRDIQSQKHAEAVINKALRRVNKDRVGVVHHKRKARTERRLRANVGSHMWTIVAALKELI